MKFPVLAATLVLTAAPALAQMTMLGGEIWQEVSPDKVRTILKGLGFDAAEKAGENSTIFAFQLSNFKVTLDSHAAFMEMQLALSDKINVNVMNEWNRTHRFTRAYRDTDGGATLEADLDFGGGIAKANIESFIKGFSQAIPAFTKVVVDSQGTATDRPPTAQSGNTRLGAGSDIGGNSGSLPSGPGILNLLEGRINIRYDPAKWKPKPTDEANRYEFSYAKGDGFAVVIAERAGIPTDSIADIAFANIRKKDPNARLTLKQMRRVGGVDVWFQTVDATVERIPVTYYGYYWGGSAGTVQVLTYTARNLVNEYARDFLEFMNGLRVSY